MTEDPRCCGTGTCIINDDGECWCGQKWDGEKMCFPKSDDTGRVDAQSADQNKPVEG
jgi:hypothetical protein